MPNYPEPFTSVPSSDFNRMASIASAAELMEKALRGDGNTWGKDCPEFLEWLADRCEWEADRQNLHDCTVKEIRSIASNIRSALAAYEEAKK